METLLDIDGAGLVFDELLEVFEAAFADVILLDVKCDLSERGVLGNTEPNILHTATLQIVEAVKTGRQHHSRLFFVFRVCRSILTSCPATTPSRKRC